MLVSNFSGGDKGIQRQSGGTLFLRQLTNKTFTDYLLVLGALVWELLGLTGTYWDSLGFWYFGVGFWDGQALSKEGCRNMFVHIRGWLDSPSALHIWDALNIFV